MIPKDFSTVKAPETPFTEEETDFNTLSIAELTKIKAYFLRRQFAFDKSLYPEDNTKEQQDAAKKFVIVNRILNEKLTEQDNTQKIADQSYVNIEVSKNLGVLRYAIDPPSNTNALPFGRTLETLGWFTPTNTTLKFKAPLHMMEHGRKKIIVEDLEFDLLTMNADKLRRMLNHHFSPEAFRVKNHTIFIMVV